MQTRRAETTKETRVEEDGQALQSAAKFGRSIHHQNPRIFPQKVALVQKESERTPQMVKTVVKTGDQVVWSLVVLFRRAGFGDHSVAAHSRHQGHF